MASGCTCTCTDQIWVVTKRMYMGCMDGYHCGRKNKGCNHKRYGSDTPVPFFKAA